MDDKSNEQVLEIYFPFRGMDKSVAYKNQILLTSQFMQNVRIKDASENINRGGQRFGQSKVFIEQAGEDRPIIKMVAITNTYIPSIG